MGFILRVQSRNASKRLEFASVESTWRDLQDEIQRQFDVPVASQRISKELNGALVVCESPHWSFAMLGLSHGDKFFLQDEWKQAATVTTAPPSRLTKDCTHGPKGRCINCMPTDSDTYKMKGVCDHGSNATCTNCNTHVQSGTKELAEWLCDHPDYAFCPKCMPPEDEQPESTTESHFKPYALLMSERQALCRYKHTGSTTCHSCAPPQELSFRGNPLCPSGHRPWPNGICDRCRPPNAILRLQKYRHVDGVRIGQRFISEWQSNPGLQRAAILFGTVVPEPTRGEQGAVRAEVLGMYMPPQHMSPTGCEFLHDPFEQDTYAVARCLGLVPVGWVITSLPRSDEVFGTVFMSGAEIRQAARFQHTYGDSLEHARFVTMIMEYNSEGQIEPKAYMISDQGVAMERDGLLADGKEHVGAVAARVPKASEYIPSIIYKNKVLEPGKDFSPDQLIVPVVAMQPYQPDTPFKYADFPLHDASEVQLRHYLATHLGGYEERLSDFALLCFLPQVLGTELACAVATGVIQGSIPREVSDQLDYKLAQFY